MKTVGDIIKARRKALGLTLEQVGDFCGVGKSTVRKWEEGVIQNMRRDKIALLSEILMMNPVDLIEPGEAAVISVTGQPSALGELSEEETLLISAYRKAPDSRKAVIMELLEKYTKED